MSEPDMRGTVCGNARTHGSVGDGVPQGPHLPGPKQHVYSIDRVRNELLASNDTDELVRWVRNDAPREFFLSDDTDEVVGVYTQIILWAHRHPNYSDAAKMKFASGADGWLVACARVGGATVVTNEQSAPESRRVIKLPDVCSQFDVSRETVFGMFRTLNVLFDWLASDK